MKPMQSLGIINRLFPHILSGTKTSTIRWRETPISLGPMRYTCDGAADQTVIVNVVRCTDMPLSEAATYLGMANEWPYDVMLAGMREHYPDIKLSDIVQVIEHEPVAQ
jgi:hypothetical protein